MVKIKMINLNEFNKEYESLNDVVVTESLLHSIWNKVISKHRRTVDDFFPAQKRIIFNIPYIYLSDMEYDESDLNNRYNIIIDETDEDKSELSTDEFTLIESFMRKIIAYRFGYAFKYSFHITNSKSNMWNCHVKSRGKKFNKNVFAESAETFVRDSTKEAEYHYDCVRNNIDHTLKHRTSKYIVTFENYYDMVEYAMFNIINNTDTRHVQFIITNYINGKLISTKRGRAIPYTFISCLYDMFDNMDDGSKNVLSMQVSLVLYEKKG